MGGQSQGRGPKQAPSTDSKGLARLGRLMSEAWRAASLAAPCKRLHHLCKSCKVSRLIAANFCSKSRCSSRRASYPCSQRAIACSLSQAKGAQGVG
eukprot:1155609-Pelagomonas_calceolata.AAC.1